MVLTELEKGNRAGLSSSDRATVKDVVARLMERSSVDDASIIYSKFMGAAINTFKPEKALLHIDSDKTILVSDLHGDIGTFRRIANRYPPGEYTYIVMGDNVNRGRESFELLALLLGNKLLNPDKFIMLKGDHETPEIGKKFTFPYEIAMKLGDNSMIETVYEKLFAQLPMAATLNGKYYVAHGGIPLASPELKVLEESEKMASPPRDSDMYEIMWGDPHLNGGGEFTNGMHNSRRGKGMHEFGADVLKSFLDRNGLDMFIRGHMHQYSGKEMGNILLNVSSPDILKIERFASEDGKEPFSRVDLISLDNPDGVPTFRKPDMVKIAQ